MEQVEVEKMAPKTSQEKKEERRSILKVVTNTIRERKKKVYQGNQKQSLFALAMVIEDGQNVDDNDVEAIGSMDGIDVEATGSPVPRFSAKLEKVFQKIEDAAKRIAPKSLRKFNKPMLDDCAILEGEYEGLAWDEIKRRLKRLHPTHFLRLEWSLNRVEESADDQLVQLFFPEKKFPDWLTNVGQIVHDACCDDAKLVDNMLVALRYGAQSSQLYKKAVWKHRENMALMKRLVSVVAVYRLLLPSSDEWDGFAVMNEFFHEAYLDDEEMEEICKVLELAAHTDRCVEISMSNKEERDEKWEREQDMNYIEWEWECKDAVEEGVNLKYSFCEECPPNDALEKNVGSAEEAKFWTWLSVVSEKMRQKDIRCTQDRYEQICALADRIGDGKGDAIDAMLSVKRWNTSTEKI